MLHRYVLHNGQIREARDNLLSPGQVGLLSGWGVFTTLKVADGVLFAFERHWARMSRDAALLHVPMPDAEETHRQLIELVEANQKPNATMRVAIVRNTGGLWEGPAIERKFDVLALMADLKDWGDAVKLCCVPQARHAASLFAGVKVLSWAFNLTWLEQAQRDGFDEVILLNERGEVAECTSANIFAGSENQIWTPPLSSGCLPGVTREILLAECHIPGYTLSERTLFPADLEQAEEVFITSTTRDLLSVSTIGDRPVGSGGFRIRAAAQAVFAACAERYRQQRQSVSARIG